MRDASLKKWNDAAESYTDAQERSAYADANKAVVKARFKKLHGEKALDLGCGYGYYTDYFRTSAAAPLASTARRR